MSTIGADNRSIITNFTDFPINAVTAIDSQNTSGNVSESLDASKTNE